MSRALDYVALVAMLSALVTIIYAVIYIHDIPYEIAKKRGHPHQDAIHTAGWVSLFLMHTIWPFLWIWATLYKPGVGWGFADQTEGSDQQKLMKKQSLAIAALHRRLKKVEAELEQGEGH